MRNLIVSLMERENVFEERTIRGVDGWMDEYRAVCNRYCQNMMSNDKLEMRVRIAYELE